MTCKSTKSLVIPIMKSDFVRISYEKTTGGLFEEDKNSYPDESNPENQIHIRLNRCCMQYSAMV